MAGVASRKKAKKMEKYFSDTGTFGEIKWILHYPLTNNLFQLCNLRAIFFKLLKNTFRGALAGRP
jgi:hypothetical protein